MALLWIDDCGDHYATAQLADRYDTATNVQIAAGEGRFGDAALLMPYDSRLTKDFYPVVYNTLVVGFPYRATSLVVQVLFNLLLHQTIPGGGESTVIQAYAAVKTDGSIVIYNGDGTLLGETGRGLLTGHDYYIEIKVVFHSSTGSISMRVNGEDWITASGLDTTKDGNPGGNGVDLRLASDYHYFSDLYIDSADFKSDCRVECLRPTGPGSNTEWTPSAGANWQCVDENPPNTSDYVETDAESLDTYVFGNLSTVSGTVKGVAWEIYANFDDETFVSINIRPAVLISGTVYYGPDIALVADIEYHQYIWETSPATSSAWTIAEINGAEFGYKIPVGVLDGAPRVYQAAVLVLVEPDTSVAQVSQAAVITLAEPDTADAQVSQVAVVTLAEPDTQEADVSQAAVVTLVAKPQKYRVEVV